jgi:cell division septal protein FtsQ
MKYRRSPSRRTYSPVRRRQPVILRSKFKMEQKKRVRTASRYLMFVILGAVALFMAWRGLNSFFHSDTFTIRQVEIHGAKNISDSEIIALLPFRPGDNILRIFVGETERNIRECKPELKLFISTVGGRGW